MMCSLLLGLVSCSDEAFDVDSVNKQTILVFMPWTGSSSGTGLTYYLRNNLDSISQAIIDSKGLSNSRLMVFFSESAGSSKLYEFQYDATQRTVNRIEVKAYQGNSYNTADGFADILNEVRQRAEALNYSLIIGAHGCGWSYADDWTNYPSRAKGSLDFGSESSSTQENEKPVMDVPTTFSFGDDPNLPLTRFFGSVKLDGYKMDVTTLAEGIRQSGMKMQYILFDACYMGNAEVAYELKDVTNYLIASSSEIMGRGIPYRSIWRSLNSSTPSYSGIVSGVVNYYKSSDTPYCNLAAIDCRQMDALAEVMKKINKTCSLNANVPLDSIQPLDGFKPSLSYDLKVYVDSLHPNAILKDEFTHQLSKTVKVTAHTDKAITSLFVSSGELFNVKSYCGLSISDPSQHPVAIKGREKTAWWKATHESE